MTASPAPAPARPELSRRGIVRTAAWAAPVIATAVAAPLAAASTEAVTVQNVGSSGSVYGGETASIVIEVRKGGLVAAGESVAFVIASGSGTLGAASVVTDAQGRASTTLVITVADSTAVVGASVLGASASVAVTALAPALTVTPNVGVDPAVANVFTLSGRGFVGPQAAYGVYATIFKKSAWSGNAALTFNYEAVAWVSSLTAGAFTTTLSIAANTFLPTEQYHAATSAAHGLSALTTGRTMDAFADIAIDWA
ncbi:hypothetical protein HQQ81_08505 [Microbacteriaceae bacterium VKM Ac-2854]|nr:hypothetical protein [Microbacteriaceae bacterium VKM Ac-2854]